MVMGDVTVHPQFKLNGFPYTSSELKELAYDLVKEGSPFEKPIGNFLSDWLDDHPTIEVKTSGSTGTPKNILLQKKQMVNSAVATGEFFDLIEGKTALLCLPADYIAGKMMIVRAMVLGLELDYIEPSSGPLAGISKSYDFAAMIPLQLENSLTEVERIRTLIVGGAAISKPLKEKVQGKTTTIFETYGMTETITHIAVRAVNSSNSTALGTGHIENNFNALPNVMFSNDSRQCLVISASKICDKPVITNDIVNLISETEFEWLGRYDNVINSGGIKVFPEQIEKKLAVFLGNRFFVTGIPDEKLGQKLVLIVEGEIDSEELLQNVKSEGNLEWFEIPKKVFGLSKFVETDTGKILRKENIRLIAT